MRFPFFFVVYVCLLVVSTLVSHPQNQPTRREKDQPHKNNRLLLDVQTR
jgi:hypothetical protein